MVRVRLDASLIRETVRVNQWHKPSHKPRRCVRIWSRKPTLPGLFPLRYNPFHSPRLGRGFFEDLCWINSQALKPATMNLTG